MSLINKKYAIHNGESNGPTFGNGHDIYLSDKCNQNNKSFANFPGSYNCNGIYKNSQQSYSIFSGATEKNNFKVI